MTIAIRKWIILIHRWMGVAFCVLFAAWFLSGIVMMYWRYPRVDAEDRLARAPALDAAKILAAPDRALANIKAGGAPSQVRIHLLDGRPVYRFGFGRRSALAYADTGQTAGPIPQQMALRIAAAWTRLPAESATQGDLMTEDDQWTVGSSIRTNGPFWKFTWGAGDEVYVSQPTGDVVQHTTWQSRIGAYFGAIPHWLYFTPLRSRSAVWTQVIIWLSGAGVFLSILGLIVGVWVYSPSKRYRSGEGASSVPYAGQKHWHVILGLIFGAVTCTWTFSGLLSMGPFEVLSDPARPKLETALRAGRVDLTKFAAKAPGDAIAGGRVKELEFASFGGEAFYIATEAPGKTRLIPIEGDSLDTLPTDRIIEAVKKAAAPLAIAESRVVNEYEAYYADRMNRRPLPVVYVELNDPIRSAYYIDPKSGRVVQSYGTRSRWNRWLYHGFHSLDLPWLYANRPAWDIVMIALLLGGSALSITSVVIAYQVVQRKLRRT